MSSSQYKKALVVIHREESAEDFREIAMRIKQLDPFIRGAMVPEYASLEMFPPEFLELPLLVVYLVNPPSSNSDQGVFPNAINLSVQGIDKIEEYEHFKKHNIPCLPIERFYWGMELSLETYGDWVVLKPQKIQSTGKDVNMIPTKVVSQLKSSDFPENHLIHQDGYYVQKFVRTSAKPTNYRVLVFLGQILMSRIQASNYDYPEMDLDDLKKYLNISVASNADNRIGSLYKEDEINEFALNVAKSFPELPLLGIDIIRDHITQKLYVLELNSGGNVWHFSSKFIKKFLIKKLGLEGYKEEVDKRVSQYMAWDKAALALINSVNKL